MLQTKEFCCILPAEVEDQHEKRFLTLHDHSFDCFVFCANVNAAIFLRFRALVVQW